MRQFATSFLMALILASIAEAVRVESVSLGMDGYVRNEKWVPVVFYLSNSGGDFRGTLEVIKGGTIFRKSLELGAGARKRMEVLYYHSNQYENMYYQILNQEGSIVLKDKLDPRLLNYADNLLLVISGTEFGHQFLNGQANPWGGKSFVAYKKPDELFEEWLSYTVTDGIAIGTLSAASLLPSQWQALLQYAATGGVLICSSVTDLSIIRHPSLRNHFPRVSTELNLIGTGDFLMHQWARYSADPLPTFSFPAQTLYPKPADRQLAGMITGSSLATSSPFWKGNIIYFAFDYTRVPEQIAAPYAKYWNGLIYPTVASGQPFALPFRKRLEENPRVQKALYDIPGLKLPDVKWFALFFFIYVCAIGPLQFLVIKILKKSTLLWITFPLIIALFTMASLVYSKYRQSGERRITQVSVVEVFPAINLQTTYQVYGVTIKESGTFRFQAVPSNSFLRKFAFQSLSYTHEPYELSEDLPREIQNETMKNWTFRTFDSMSLEPATMHVKVQASIQNKELRGEISNSTDYAFQDAFFLYDVRNSVSLGTIPAGATRSFSLQLTNSSPVPFAEFHLRDLLHLYSASYSDPHFFYGQINNSAGELVMNGKPRKTHCTRYVAVYTDIKESGPLNFWSAGSF